MERSRCNVFFKVSLPTLRLQRCLQASPFGMTDFDCGMGCMIGRQMHSIVTDLRYPDTAMPSLYISNGGQMIKDAISYC